MPLVEDIHYRPPLWMRNGHLATIVPFLLRRNLAPPPYRQTVRLNTPDDDFLELDYYPSALADSEKTVLLLHGLESSARAGYMIGLGKVLRTAGYNVWLLNFRSCSGTPNLQLRSYHSGETEDVRFVANYLRSSFPTHRLYLAGFSLGGNAGMKYMGEEGGESLFAAAAFVSVPCDLAGSSDTISTGKGKIYLHRFLKSLKYKAEIKNNLFPGRLNMQKIRAAKTFREFDDSFTAPVHGFANAADYMARSSSAQFISGIKKPVLLINALNDPFLSPGCYPADQAAASAYFTFIQTGYGGHVGFSEAGNTMQFFYTSRFISFFETGGLYQA